MEAPQSLELAGPPCVVSVTTHYDSLFPIQLSLASVTRRLRSSCPDRCLRVENLPPDEPDLLNCPGSFYRARREFYPAFNPTRKGRSGKFHDSFRGLGVFIPTPPKTPSVGTAE